MVGRIDNSTAVLSLPALPVPTGQPGFFTGGDPVSGEGATIVDAWWLNNIQEELISVVQAAGEQPDRSNNHQLLDAIKLLISTISQGINADFVLSIPTGKSTDLTTHQIGYDSLTGNLFVKDQTGVFHTFQPAGDYAVSSDFKNLGTALQNEINRATTTEAGKLNKAGDVSSGDQIFDNGISPTAWVSSSQVVFRIGGNVIRLYGQMTGDGDIQLNIGGMGGNSWAFRPDKGVIATPSFNSLLEVTSKNPCKLQAFTVTTDAGQSVTFPQAFTGTPMAIIVNALENDWDVGAAAGTWTPAGFTVSSYSANTKGAPQQLSVIAIGPSGPPQ